MLRSPGACLGSPVFLGKIGWFTSEVFLNMRRGPRTKNTALGLEVVHFHQQNWDLNVKHRVQTNPTMKICQPACQLGQRPQFSFYPAKWGDMVNVQSRKDWETSVGLSSCTKRLLVVWWPYSLWLAIVKGGWLGNARTKWGMGTSSNSMWNFPACHGLVTGG